tara:strand:+ start:414 stop:719 length:306 start_codon:yes stop_codon:yes gene_type:complete
MKNFFIYIFLFLFIVSCQSTKDALTLKKKSSADEFLVEKKSPLVLPPEYGKLPTPNSGLINENMLEDNDDNIVIDEESLTSKKNTSENNSSIEKTILEKIK